jgi:predicted transcriptional regulator
MDSQTRQQVRERRVALKWSQSELARRADVCQNSVSSFELGKRGLRWGTLEKVLAALEAGEGVA